MSETPETQTAEAEETTPDAEATAAADASTEPTEQAGAEADKTEVEKPEAASAAREAAKWRRQYREAESQVAALTERLTTLQRREVERLAAFHMADPEDLWRSGVELTEMLDEDGNVDQGKVTETVENILRQHRHWKKPAPAAAPATDVGTSGLGATPTSFTDAFRPKGR